MFQKLRSNWVKIEIESAKKQIMSKDFDTHIAVYKFDEIKSTMQLLESLKEEGKITGLKNKIIEVVGSSEANFPKAIFTCEVNELDALEANHKAIASEIRKRNISAILESEQNFEIGDLNEPVEFVGEMQLWNEDRNNDFTKHWGDIHIDIPTTYETTEIRRLFNLRRFNYIITVKKDRPKPYTIVTCQFKSNKQLKGIITLVKSIARNSNYPLEGLDIKGERLIDINSFGSIPLLPITVDLRPVNHKVHS